MQQAQKIGPYKKKKKLFLMKFNIYLKTNLRPCEARKLH